MKKSAKTKSYGGANPPKEKPETTEVIDRKIPTDNGQGVAIHPPGQTG